MKRIFSIVMSFFLAVAAVGAIDIEPKYCEIHETYDYCWKLAEGKQGPNSSDD
ncbi:hypothetical protein AAK899_01230 [Erysipelotrichaceae bacterium 51-3]